MKSIYDKKLTKARKVLEEYMLTEKEKEFVKKAKGNPKLINYLYGELKDYSRVIELLGIDEDSVVLDIGSGRGKLLVDIVWRAKCKGIGVEPILSRHLRAVEYAELWAEPDTVELHNDHYPCKTTMKPTHVILHACAFSEKNAIDCYNALPRGVRILHNSPHIRKYAHKNKLKSVEVKTSYVKGAGASFYLHEK